MTSLPSRSHSWMPHPTYLDLLVHWLPFLPIKKLNSFLSPLRSTGLAYALLSRACRFAPLRWCSASDNSDSLAGSPLRKNSLNSVSLFPLTSLCPKTVSRKLCPTKKSLFIEASALLPLTLANFDLEVLPLCRLNQREPFLKKFVLLAWTVQSLWGFELLPLQEFRIPFFLQR